ncbi:MAG: hypothetical protein D6744_03245 [Planctomycetota bacterium]|nr:MAG: hypothetical protein D6744_03245 [Planctomycetota bacterium]
MPTGYDPNNQTTPFPVTFDVDLDLFGGRTRQYFQEQLNGGRVVVMIASMADTIEGGAGGDVPSFFTKEGVGLEPGAAAPKLTITLAPQQPGDVDGDGCVDLTDLAILLANFDAVGASREQGDLDGDATVDLTDLAILLAHFDEGC